MSVYTAPTSVRQEPRPTGTTGKRRVPWGVRKRLVAWGVGLVILSVAFYACLVFFGLAATALVSDEGQVMERQPATQSQQALAARLDEGLRAVALRDGLQRHIVDELIAGQQNLRPAVDGYRLLDRAYPYSGIGFTRHSYPAPTEAASYAQQVLAQVRARLKNEPDKAVQVVTRLQR